MKPFTFATLGQPVADALLSEDLHENLPQSTFVPPSREMPADAIFISYAREECDAEHSGLQRLRMH